VLFRSVTQQNAALVEEASAAARSLEEQAGGLSHSVSLFKLEETAAPSSFGGGRTAPRPAAPAPKAAPRPVAKPAPKPVAKRPAAAANGKHAPAAPADKGGEQWTEF
jgi:methyl-accepting chemotaxis protein